MDLNNFPPFKNHFKGEIGFFSMRPSSPIMTPKESIEGIYRKKDGEHVIETRFGDNPKVWDVPVVELLEGFEGKGVRLKVEPSPQGEALYENMDWNTVPVNEVDPRYTQCSKEGRERFLDMKFGMMVHWGIYSQLGIPESWPANATRCDPEFLDVYYTLWQVFNPTEFSGDEWADLAERAGMQFFQLTTKHHDGFCMFDTQTKTWARRRTRNMGPGVGNVEDAFIHYSIMDTPYKAYCQRHGKDPDIISEVIKAFRERGMGIGLYFSHIDWNDPNFRWDKANRSFDPSYGPETHPDQWQAFIQREKTQLVELFTKYGRIDQVFFDGTWFGLEMDAMVDIILTCRDLQPDCMFSDRGIGPYGDFTSPERWIPSSSEDDRLKHRATWQVCDPIHTSWAYLPDDAYKKKSVLLKNFVDAISKGGTYVFAIAPDHRGKFPAKTVEILEFMGDWLKKNGDAIYRSRPWKKHKEEGMDVYFTKTKDGKRVHLITFESDGGTIKVSGIKPPREGVVSCLENGKLARWTMLGDILEIEIPSEASLPLQDGLAITFSVDLQ
ncbi:hypothetical protein GF325_10350 [Candidatus Bathyarchaeota archaeon]|nr:hypothetical protein [Candidatus Bathyarchaeota archaeon]